MCGMRCRRVSEYTHAGVTRSRAATSSAVKRSPREGIGWSAGSDISYLLPGRPSTQFCPAASTSPRSTRDAEESMIAVGVDTHKESHFAVALDHLGQVLGEFVIEVCSAGYAQLESWARDIAPDGQQVVFGIEGAGSWGAGLCEHLQHAGCSVLEVERPRRRERRAGKSDRIDALAAAKRVLNREGTSTPRKRGVLCALRALLVAQRSAITERTRL